jgi:hypothetical protein
MYIEFRLPEGASGQSPAHALLVIRRAIIDWSQKYNIPYTEKTIKHTHRVCFDSDEYYTFFGLTWVPRADYPNWTTYRLITDLNNKI